MAKRRRSGPTLIQRSRSVSSEEKAIYHNVTGAGRSGMKRAFLDLSEADKNLCIETLDRMMDERLRQL
jgi:hypothetical protein